MNAFVQALTAGASANTLTENGGVARSTTGTKVLDLFSQIGALRNNQERCNDMVIAANNEDADLTARCVFYSRDPRGGQGERQTFRTNMRSLIKADPRYKNLIDRIPEFGRWDDVVDLMDVAEAEAIESIKNQLHADIGSATPSLLGKWLPSENASSSTSKSQAQTIRRGLGMDARQYRKMLSALRKQIGIVESLMSSGQWDSINFQAVPSNAMLLYRNAFGTRAPEKFAAYKAALANGEAKINASVLFPYDLVGKYLSRCEVDPIIEAQWKALPDYFDGKTENSLVVCDVSGSMCGLPMQVSISLGIYVAERNKGVWKNKFITFSEIPTIQTLEGTTLQEQVINLNGAAWDMNTNIVKVFELVLNTAKVSKIDPADMIKRLYIVSDMEFDAAADGNATRTVFQHIKETFDEAGYTMPELVFWNVAARNAQVPMAMDERGFLNVSGCSPSIFKFTLGKEFASAYDMMIEVLCSPKYIGISVS